MPEFDNIKTKDQLGRPNSEGLIVKRIYENIKIRDIPLILYRIPLNTTQRWNTTTWNGGYWFIGVASSANMIRVINKSNVHRENFIIDDLKDESNTTGTWNTTNQRLVLADGEQAQNLAFYKNSADIFNAKLTISGEGTSNALIYLSSDGTNFESVSDGVIHGFSNIGQIGKWKIVASGNTITADEIKIEYNI